MNVYIVDEYWDNKDDWIVATTYGVFTNFKQAFYTLYSLISHRLVDYRSNGKQTIFFNSFNPSDDLKNSGYVEGIFITVYDDEYDNKIEYVVRSIKLDKIDEFSQACFKG